MVHQRSRRTAALLASIAGVALLTLVLANGEILRITQSRQPGVRLVGTEHHIRHFAVGRGENVISATDGSGNVRLDTCRVDD